MDSDKILSEIIKLKEKNDVTILAHYYQPIEIQKIADFLGDSLGLARIAREKIDTEYIIFAGVDFMAETAAILNQDKHVLIPSPEAHCPLAKFLTPNKIKEYKNKYPGLPMVVYVNSTAAVKAESDICCTSSNSVRIVQQIKEEFNTTAVLFGPDANLADYTERLSKIRLIKIPENGHCFVHSQISIDYVKNVKQAHPKAKVLVHPECVREVRELADFVGSTAKMYDYVKNSDLKENEFIIGTEMGLLERLVQDFPNKHFYLAMDKLICYSMKKNTPELMKHVLENLDDKYFEINIPKDIMKGALLSLEKMLDYSSEKINKR